MFVLIYLSGLLLNYPFDENILIYQNTSPWTLSPSDYEMIRATAVKDRFSSTIADTVRT